MDVGTVVIPQAQAAKLIEPRKRALHDPPPPAEANQAKIREAVDLLLEEGFVVEVTENGETYLRLPDSTPPPSSLRAVS